MLPAERTEAVCAPHGNLFGDAIDSIVATLWACLGQALRDGTEASSQSAVARIAADQLQSGGDVPTQGAGNDCRACAKLSVAAPRDVTVAVADLFSRRHRGTR